jgi:hypothetical protein
VQLIAILAVVVPVVVESGLVPGGLTPEEVGTVVTWVVSSGRAMADSASPPGGVSVAGMMGCGAI